MLYLQQVQPGESGDLFPRAAISDAFGVALCACPANSSMQRRDNRLAIGANDVCCIVVVLFVRPHYVEHDLLRLAASVTPNERGNVRGSLFGFTFVMAAV
jgi:hypothetical protein